LQASGRKGELADRMAAVAETARVAMEASQQASQAAEAVRARCAEARGAKKRKKALPPDLADELLAAEQAEEAASLKAEEASNSLLAAQGELSKLGSSSAKSYSNDTPVSVEEVVETTSRILRIAKFLWEENGEITLAQLIEVNIYFFFFFFFFSLFTFLEMFIQLTSICSFNEINREMSTQCQFYLSCCSSQNSFHCAA
jgi:hypothetical protein